MNRAASALLIVLVAGAGASCRIRSSSTPLDVNQQAPEFSLSDQSGQQVTLATLTEGGPAVLVFNRGHR